MTKRGYAYDFVQWRVRRVRGELLAWRIRAMGGHVGNRLRAEKGVFLRYPPHAGWHIGDEVYLGMGVVLAAPGELRLGDRVRIAHGTQVAAMQSVVIGPLTQIAEHCSVRDNDHDVKAVSMAGAGAVTRPTSIGTDVWIGRGVAVLAGVAIGDHSVIGANSVVTRDIPPRVVAFGAPAKAHHEREIVDGQSRETYRRVPAP